MEGVESLACRRLPVGGEVEGHLPFLQRIALGEIERLALAAALGDLERRAYRLQRGIEPAQRLLDGRLHALKDVVDVRVVGDGLQGDVRHGLVDEAATQAFVRVLELKVVVTGGDRKSTRMNSSH